MNKLYFGGIACALVLVATATTTGAQAQTKHYKFGYDQPHTTGYGIVGDVFNAKLKELSKGAMEIDQFPGRPTRPGAADAAAREVG